MGHFGQGVQPRPAPVYAAPVRAPWLAGLLALGCAPDERTRIVASLEGEGGPYAAAILIQDCAPGLRVRAIELGTAAIELELADTCAPDDGLTLLLYEDSLAELDLPAGPIAQASCQRDETAFETCCAPQSLPAAVAVLEATVESARFARRTDAGLPPAIASFQHNARCPCRPLARRQLFDGLAHGMAVFPDGDDAFFVAVGRRDEERTDVYHSTIEAAQGGAGLGAPIGEIEIRLFGATALPSGRWLIWDDHGKAWFGTWNGTSEVFRDPLFTRVEGFDAAAYGPDEAYFVRRVESGTATFARFDGTMQDLAPEPLPSERRCGEGENGDDDGQESSAVWLEPGRALAAPPHTSQGVHPDGYWLHDRGETRWTELDSPLGCTTAIGVLGDRRLIRATGLRRFDVLETDGWARVEIIDGPRGPSTAPAEVKMIEAYRGGFAFVGNGGSIGWVHTGLYCELVQLGSPNFLRSERMGDVLFAHGDNVSDRSGATLSLWMIWPGE